MQQLLISIWHQDPRMTLA